MYLIALLIMCLIMWLIMCLIVYVCVCWIRVYPCSFAYAIVHVFDCVCYCVVVVYLITYLVVRLTGFVEYLFGYEWDWLCYCVLDCVFACVRFFLCCLFVILYV